MKRAVCLASLNPAGFPTESVGELAQVCQRTVSLLDRSLADGG
jgi:hypothetical protein